MNDGVDLLTVVCGKTYCLDKWISYIQRISHKPALKKWIIVNNAGDDFEKLLVETIEKRNFNKNFEYVIVEGPGKFEPPKGVDWRDKEVCIGKHRSTGESFTLGFKLCTSEFVYTIDDDVIPPELAFSRMYQTMKIKPDIGALGGLYFVHAGWETGNPWRTPSQLKRTVCASIKTEHWFPAMIEDYWNRGLVESGFLGTGCTMYKLADVVKCLPMKTIPRENGLILGPDGEICESLRKLRNKKIYVDSGILCEHWETKEKEAGMGCKNFLRSTFATEKVVLCGSFGSMVDRQIRFDKAKIFAEKLNIKIVVVWPRNQQHQWKWLCPFSKDEFISEVVYINESDEIKKYEQINGLIYKRRKILNDVYFRQINSGKFAQIFNFLDTSIDIVSHSHLPELLEEALNDKA